MKTTGLKKGQTVCAFIRLISEKALTLSYQGMSIKVFTPQTANYQIGQKLTVKIDRKSKKFFIADIVSIKTATDLINAFPIGSYLSGEIVEIIHGNIVTINLLGISCKHMLIPGMEIGQPVVCQIRDFNPKNQDLIVSAIGA